MGWLYRCELFEIDHVAENMQVKLASIHLTGKAILWHQSFTKSRVMGEWPLWDEYKAAIAMRFGDRPFDDPLAELMKLRQKGTVEWYQEQFYSSLTRVEMLVPYAVSCFLSGLTNEI